MEGKSRKGRRRRMRVRMEGGREKERKEEKKRKTERKIIKYFWFEFLVSSFTTVTKFKIYFPLCILIYDLASVMCKN